MGMERWQNKVAVVTGASSGIGAAIASDLAKAGVKVVALARRENRLQENKNSLPEQYQSNYLPFKCDVTKEDQVKNVFKWVEEKFNGVDILINNAGIVKLGVDLITPDNTEAMRDVIDTNVMAAVYCVREAFNSMISRSVDGHIVLISSIAGHGVLSFPGTSLNIYCPSKFALRAMAETYRQEFLNAGTKIKISSISPGGVYTEVVAENEVFDNLKDNMLKVEDISDVVLYVLGTPPHVQIHEVIIKPMGEQF